jgi:predicted regulator of Ras-like GTPase activity (Roadblock/LC7/MglB family)
VSFTSALSIEAQNVNWLLSTFVQKTHGVEGAIGVSSDGLLMAISANLDRATADKFAAIVSGMTSLAEGASRAMTMGGVNQVIVEMRRGYLFVSQISGGSCLGVIAGRECDIGLVGYEMTLLVQRFGSLLTPSLVVELQGSLSL